MIGPAAPVLVVCLCAQWCHVCEDYRSRFAQVQQSVLADFPQCRFLWLDVEDEADLLEPLDIENFPTLLITVAGAPFFFGTITPQSQTLARLVRATLQDPMLAPLADLSVQALTQRVVAWGTGPGFTID
ncbi:MAG: thioredoxin family protein [Comamonadaceae bacterium]|nr:thioredoxin family protein [Comamonadaceae bacterium]